MIPELEIRKKYRYTDFPDYTGMNIQYKLFIKKKFLWWSYWKFTGSDTFYTFFRDKVTSDDELLRRVKEQLLYQYNTQRIKI